jgi:glutaredoxin
MNITIYTNETCSYCKSIKEELQEHDIKYKERLTTKYSHEWQEIVNLTGLNRVPTIIINDEYYVPGRDFQNAQHLLNIIETYNNSTFDLSKRTLERIKTLNYNINIAFGKLDQLLRQIENKLNIEEDEHKSTS